VLLFALQPESSRSVALIRARAALRQVSETPVPAPVALVDEPAE
jgi:hypothetical protein